MYYLSSFILSPLLWIVLIIGLIAFFVIRRNKKSSVHPNKEWYLRIFFSKEDAVSQLFFLLSFLFLNITLFSLNYDFGQLLSWHFIFFISSLIGIIISYYFKIIYVLILSVLLMIVWWIGQAFEWISEKDIKTSAIFVGLSFLSIIFYSLGYLFLKNIKFKRLAFVFSFLGVIFITISLFLLSTRIGIDTFGEITRGETFLNSWEMTLSLFIFFVIVIGLTIYNVIKKALSLFEGIAILFFVWFFVIIAFLPEQIIFKQLNNPWNEELSENGFVWAFIFNFLIFFELLGLIFSGYFRRQKWLINFGVFFLFLFIIVKYFDWFFTFLDKSVFFIGAGILLFVVGWLMERGRKYMISNLKKQIQQNQ